MIRKKKNFPRWINQSSCTSYCSTSLRFPYSKKKKIHRITLYRISNDNGSTRNGSRFSREKKKPLEYSLLASRRLPGVNAQTASNGRAFLFEFPAPLLRIICHFTGGNSFLPSPPPPPLHYLVRADRLEARPNLWESTSPSSSSV